MNLHVSNSTSREHHFANQNRRFHSPPEQLILSELNPDTVVDHLDGDSAPLDLLTFGTVRETCPKCHHQQLRLILRQGCVRTEHLFCATCESCFDARYADGASALTI